MPADCLVQVIKSKTRDVQDQKPDQSHKVREMLSFVLTGSPNQSALGNQMRVVRPQNRSAQGDLSRLLWLWYSESTLELRECPKWKQINKMIVKS